MTSSNRFFSPIGVGTLYKEHPLYSVSYGTADLASWSRAIILFCGRRNGNSEKQSNYPSWLLSGCVGLWHLAHLPLPRSLSGRHSYYPSLSADFSDQVDRDRCLSFDPAATLLLSPCPGKEQDCLPWWPESCRSQGLRIMSSGPVLENTPFPAWGPKLSNHKNRVTRWCLSEPSTHCRHPETLSSWEGMA